MFPCTKPIGGARLSNVDNGNLGPRGAVTISLLIHANPTRSVTWSVTDNGVPNLASAPTRVAKLACPRLCDIAMRL